MILADGLPLQFPRWRLMLWRLETRLRLLSPATRRYWRDQFATAPCLHDARLRGGDYAYTVFAGFYNDTVPRGHMLPDEARRICES